MPRYSLSEPQLTQHASLLEGLHGQGSLGARGHGLLEQQATVHVHQPVLPGQLRGLQALAAARGAQQHHAGDVGGSRATHAAQEAQHCRGRGEGEVGKI